jgi:hypothetical protein
MERAPGLPARLDDLEQRLRAFGAPIVDAFRPGAAPDKVRAALADEGLRAHPDVVAWWGWHDGVSLTDVPPVLSGPGVYLRPENTLVEDWHVLSLVDTVRTHRWFRADLPEPVIPPGWFPILTTGAKPTMWIDCDVPDGTPAPLYVDEHLPPPIEPLFRSLLDFVVKILRAFDEGLVRSHPEDARVAVFDAAALTGELRRLSYW